MKALRIVGIVLLSIFLVIVTCLFTYSFSFKEVVKGVTGDIVSFTDLDKSSGFMDGIGSSDDINADPKVREIMEDKEVQAFIEKYVDITLEGFSGKDLSDVDLSKDLIELIEDKQEMLNEAGIEITDEDIAEFKNSEDYNELNKNYNKMFDDVSSDMNNSEMQFIKTFSFLGTNSFRTTCLILIFVSVLLIGLLSWSLFKWLLPIGIDCIVSGVLTSGGGLLLYLFSTALLKSYTIKTFSLFAFGFSLIVVGIVMIIIYAIFKGKEKKNAVSKVSE